MTKDIKDIKVTGATVVDPKEVAANAAAKLAEKANPETPVVDGFLSPFAPGVTYADFLKSIPKGVSIEDHCKKDLEKDQINWLISDLDHLVEK
jgi:hypothetical protein